MGFPRGSVSTPATPCLTTVFIALAGKCVCVGAAAVCMHAVPMTFCGADCLCSVFIPVASHVTHIQSALTGRGSGENVSVDPEGGRFGGWMMCACVRERMHFLSGNVSWVRGGVCVCSIPTFTFCVCVSLLILVYA